jgi:hypothetical protein
MFCIDKIPAQPMYDNTILVMAYYVKHYEIPLQRPD